MNSYQASGFLQRIWLTVLNTRGKSKKMSAGGTINIHLVSEIRPQF